MKNWILTAAALFVFTTAATAAANAPDDDKRPDRTPMKGRMVENRTVKFDALPEAAQAFIEKDPFFKVGLFANIKITRWRKAYVDGVCKL